MKESLNAGFVRLRYCDKADEVDAHHLLPCTSEIKFHI
jgi:hypothetical protein